MMFDWVMGGYLDVLAFEVRLQDLVEDQVDVGDVVFVGVVEVADGDHFVELGPQLVEGGVCERGVVYFEELGGDVPQDLQLVEDVSVELGLQPDDDLVDQVDRVAGDDLVFEGEVAERLVDGEEDELFDAFEYFLVFDEAREDRVGADESCLSRVYGSPLPSSSGRPRRSPKSAPGKRANSTPCSSACCAG